MKRLLLIILLLSVIAVLPSIIHHYIYPTAGDDTAYHLIYFQNMEHQKPLYPAQWITGKLMNVFPDMIEAFSFFHYIALVMMIVTIGLSVGLAVNWYAGIIALFITLGLSQLFNLFYYGQIFDLIGIAILLPWAILCYSRSRKISNNKNALLLIGYILLICLYYCWHPNGQYVYALFVIIGVYWLISHKVRHKLRGILRGVWDNKFIIYSIVLGICLCILSTFGVGQPDPNRLIMDASILLFMGIAGIIGLIIQRKGTTMVKWIGFAVAIGICIPSITLWMQDNSVVKQVDKQAIEYLNELDGEKYSVFPNVTWRIYNLYTDKEFLANDYYLKDSDYVIFRSVPMTPQSDPDEYYFRSEDYPLVEQSINKYDFKLLETFDCDERDRNTGEPIIVQIYAK